MRARRVRLSRGLSVTAVLMALALGASGCGTDKMSTGSIGRTSSQPVETMSSGQIHAAAVRIGETYAHNPNDKRIAIKYATVLQMDGDADHIDRGDEIWGNGFFVGVYPVKDRAGVFVGGDRVDMRAGPAAFVAAIRRDLTRLDPWLDAALARVAVDRDPYYWKLTDCRAESWTIGRVGLLGDAAAGFLPTAGIGAGMAMESAGVLAQALAGVARESVPDALRDYERRQGPRVEAAQDSSRQLARLMFRRNAALAMIRDLAVRAIPLGVVLRPIRKLLDEAPA